MKPVDRVAALGWSGEPNIRQIQREKERAGLVLGLLAGLVLALAAWGVDGLALARAHAFWPWLKLALAGPLCILLCGAAGWLQMRSPRAVVGVIVWAGLGVLVGWAGGRLPYGGVTAALSALDPGLARLLSYDFGAGPLTRAWLAALLAGGAALFGGILFPGAVEAQRAATAPAGRWLAFLVAAVLLAVAGYAVDAMVNQPLRQPVVVMDTLVQYALDHRAAPVDPAVAREIHLPALNPIRDLLPDPRRLILASNDETVEGVRVLINFGGQWVRCTLTNEQPNFCERVAE